MSYLAVPAAVDVDEANVAGEAAVPPSEVVGAIGVSLGVLLDLEGSLEVVGNLVVSTNT